MNMISKRIISSITALCMLLCICCTAVATDALSAVIGNASGAPGDTVTVTVSLAENPGITGYDATLTYDSEVLTLAEITQLLPGDNFSTTDSSVSFSTAEATSGTDLFSASFIVNEGAAAGSTTVSATGSATTDTATAVSLSFTDGSVTVTEAAPTAYTVTISQPANGSASADAASYTAGATVTLTATANSGYTFAGWSSTDGVSFADSSAAQTTFVMPEKNVTVSAAFTEAVTGYTITDATPAGGTVNISKTTADKGEEIVMTAAPAEGYYFKNWTVTDESGNPVRVDNDEAKVYFNMPEKNISVCANFEALPSGRYALTVYNEKGRSINVKNRHYDPKTVIELHAELEKAYTFITWKCLTDNIIFANPENEYASFSMPQSNVIITTECEYDSTVYYTLKLFTDGGGGTAEAHDETGNNKDDEDLRAGEYRYAEGDRVKLLATPIAGYTFAGWKTTYEEVDIVNPGNYIAYFTMPAMDVSIKAEFVLSSFVGTQGGTVTGNGAGAGAGGGAGTQPTNTILVSFNTGGGTFIDSATINYGSTVMRPATDPVQSGYTFAGWYTDPSYTTPFNFSTPVYGHTTIYAKWINASSQLFSDVKSSEWYYQYVNALSTQGIVGGIGNNKFAPGSNITRAQVIKILAGLAGVTANSYGSSGFSDVKESDWFAPYVAWAKSVGIAGGSGNKFMPNAPISRQDIAVMISRYAQYKSINLPYGVGANFADSSKIAPYATNAVSSMQAAGIIGGKNGNLFDPLANATRAEACKMIYVFMNL